MSDGQRFRMTGEWATRKIAALRGYGSTADGHIRATVDRFGMLIRLELSPEISYTSEQDIAHVIMDVIQLAVADVRDQIREVHLALQKEGIIRTLPPALPLAPAVNQITLDILRRTKPETPCEWTSRSATSVPRTNSSCWAAWP